VIDPVPAVLSAWENFYIIVGSSGAALTGLMFVVIALIADSPKRRSTHEIDAFGTPTIVHFCVVLLVAAILSAPWHGLGGPATAIGAVGGGGVAYIAIVFRRARRQTGYEPVFEDWIWYTILPFAVYAGFLVSGIVLRPAPVGALFVVGAGTLVLLLIGIHNAWDTVTFIAVEMRGAPNESGTNESVSK
jgi:hypothetical protein